MIIPKGVSKNYLIVLKPFNINKNESLSSLQWAQANNFLYVNFF